MILRDYTVSKSKNHELAQRFIKFQKTKNRSKRYLRKYKIDLSQVFELKRKQNHCCAICKKDLEAGKKTHVDHDHFTLKVRGILCSNCNLGLGMFKDNPEYLENAITYLQRNNSEEKHENTN
jgi:hypothetical protein